MEDRWQTRLSAFVKNTFNEVVSVFLTLFKIMLPVSIVIKILQELNFIGAIGSALSPLMKLVGLPGAYGLVWASSFITNMYGGIIVFFSIFPGNPITSAQVTVLGVMILVAHSFPVELTIARKAGIRIRYILTFRFLNALILGWLVYKIYSLFGLFEKPVTLKWMPAKKAEGLGVWALSELKNYIVIFLIIMALITIMNILKKIGFIGWLNDALKPVLRMLGLSANAAPLTMIGLTLGISYGGGIIINEAKSGKLNWKDILFSISLLSLCHSLIEDTLLMVAIGANVTGVLIMRILYAFILISLLVALVPRLSDRFIRKNVIVNIDKT
ncbi:MAG: hypothetical protein JW737_08350 [Acidobacteria bacterium]|nr:hypothetical protein [Acidobacteriota bacterium]